MSGIEKTLYLYHDQQYSLYLMHKHPVCQEKMTVD